MSTHPTHPASASTCAPYRSPPSASPAPSLAPSLGRALTLAFSALTLAFSMASVSLLHRALQAPRVSLRARSVTLDRAALDLARRHRRSIYIAPDVSARSRSLQIADGAIEGEFAPALRALNAHAATHGMWLHEVDEVLRLERAVPSATLRCDDTLAVCTARLARVATLDVTYPEQAATRLVRLRAHPGVTAVNALRGAIEAAGLTVDRAGRSLYVTAPAADVGGLGERPISLSRNEIDALMASAYTLRPAVRITPVMHGGRTLGVRVLGVREGSLVARLGLESGDVLTRVNGFAIASPERCFEAYNSLRRSDIVTLELTRRGRAMTLTYALGDHHATPS